MPLGFGRLFTACARHIASKTDVEQAHAVGASAVDAALVLAQAKMVAIERVSSSLHRWKTKLVPLNVRMLRKMPVISSQEMDLGLPRLLGTTWRP